MWERDFFLTFFNYTNVTISFFVFDWMDLDG